MSLVWYLCVTKQRSYIDITRLPNQRDPQPWPWPPKLSESVNLSMGCCASSEEPVEEIKHEDIGVVESGVTEVEQANVNLTIAEADAVEAKPGSDTFISSVLKARADCADDDAIMADCCTRLQAYNRRLKEYISIYDAQTVNEATNGGFLGLGCNDTKLIAALCTRTKSQLQRTCKQYRNLYDKDMRAEVDDETSGGYKKLMWYALAAADEYIADIIDRACDVALIGPDLGCDETALLEVFVTHTQAELQAGKAKWEGRTDNHLVDHLESNLGSSYRHLNRLINLLYMGDRNESDSVDEALAAEQVAALYEECEKGWFEDFDESQIIEIIGANTTKQNALVAQLYEKEHGESLSRALKEKCGDRLHYALAALLLSTEDFIAMRLHDAMKGWFNNKDLLTRMLGGLDGKKMQGVCEAYESKYDQPLWSALKENIDGDFLQAGLTWVRALGDPARGAEATTEVDVSELDGDASQLANMLDWLLLENEALLVSLAQLDVETIREAVKGWGTDDTVLIRAICTRNKRALARVNIGYREAYGTPLQALIDEEIQSTEKPWYAYLAKFLVVQEQQADSMILDLAMAMDDGTVDHDALVEFICARHPKRVRAAKARWEASHDDSLIDLLADHLSGDMKRLALTLLKGKRDRDSVTTVSDERARKQAHGLHDGELDFVDVLASNSTSQNKRLAEEYENAYDESLRRAISSEFTGNVKDALLALLMGPGVCARARQSVHASSALHALHVCSCDRMRTARVPTTCSACALALPHTHTRPRVLSPSQPTFTRCG